jgi:hypothetical protein
VSETDEAGAPPKLITDTPLDATSYEEPVTFGKNRCLVVRSVLVQGAVTILGPSSAPLCVTPRDKFPPPAPTGLAAIADVGAVDLVWSGVDAADLAGYIVLRATGANGTLRPLMTDPITTTSYRDTTAQSGTSYVYAVQAIDKATPPNSSELSERKPATAKAPATRSKSER